MIGSARRLPVRSASSVATVRGRDAREREDHQIGAEPAVGLREQALEQTRPPLAARRRGGGCGSG